MRLGNLLRIAAPSSVWIGPVSTFTAVILLLPASGLAYNLQSSLMSLGASTRR